MCIIIDANCAAAVANTHADAKPVLECLLKGASHVAIGGSKLSEEYKKVAKLISFLSTLDTAGRVRRFPNGEVDAEQKALEKSKLLKSDDPHIIALAKISGSRLLFSKDVALHADFGNIAILNPKGKIYQDVSHAHLLVAPTKCNRAT